MSKSVTVQFDDGTSHVYEDVPDDVTNGEVEERASTDFGKAIAGVNLPTEAQTAQQNYENQGMLEKAAGAATAGLNLAGQAMTHPVGMALEGLAGGKYAIDKISNAIANRVPGPVAPTVAQPAAQGMAQAVNAQAVGARPTLSVQAGGPPAAPAAPTPAAPTPAQIAPAAESSFVTKANDIVRKLALDKVLKGAGAAAGAYELGKGLFGTSPEEIATMKAAEARKRAQGWKPLNER